MASTSCGGWHRRRSSHPLERRTAPTSCSRSLSPTRNKNSYSQASSLPTGIGPNIDATALDEPVKIGFDESGVIICVVRDEEALLPHAFSQHLLTVAISRLYLANRTPKGSDLL